MTSVLALFGGVLTAAVAPVQRSCTATTTSVCRGPTDTTVTTSETEYLTGEGCVQCHAPHCNLSNPNTGVLCRPYQRQCAMCGDPDLAMISTDYTVLIRPNCNSVEACAGTTVFNNTITFAHLPVLDISMAPSHVGDTVTAAVCPLFHFIGATDVRLADLIIDCQSTSDTVSAPAILFERSATLRLTAVNIHAYGWARATILVSGGLFDVLPPTRSTALSGNVSNISVGRDGVRGRTDIDRYIDAEALVLFDFTGSLNVTGLANFTSLTVSPAAGGALVYPPSLRLAITNMATVSNIQGTPIASEFTTDGDMYGLTREEEDSTASTVALWLGFGFLVQATLALLLHQDMYALFRDAKAAR